MASNGLCETMQDVLHFLVSLTTRMDASVKMAMSGCFQLTSSCSCLELAWSKHDDEKPRRQLRVLAQVKYILREVNGGCRHKLPWVKWCFWCQSRGCRNFASMCDLNMSWQYAEMLLRTAGARDHIALVRFVYVVEELAFDLAEQDVEYDISPACIV